MENTIRLIKDFFEKENWKYDYIADRTTFTSGVRMNSILGTLRIYIYVQKDAYIVSVVLNSTAEKEHYAEVAEYLHRANYGLHNGNFEFDYRDGEIRYKTYVNFEDIELSASIVEDSIFCPIFMFDKYGKNLMRVMLGEGEPEELINEAENSDISDTDE